MNNHNPIHVPLYGSSISPDNRHIGPPALSSMNADFFLTSIAPDFCGIGDSLISCFLHPGTHFILILIEAVPTKYFALGESSWCCLYESLSNLWIICLFSIPPRCFQHVVWIVNPLWARNSIAFTEKFDSGSTKHTPTMSKLRILYWSDERFTD